jgi:urocanate hydratase
VLFSSIHNGGGCGWGEVINGGTTTCTDTPQCSNESLAEVRNSTVDSDVLHVHSRMLCLLSGFGLVLVGDADSASRAKSMLAFDVNNGVARRAWAGNDNASIAIQR